MQPSEIDSDLNDFRPWLGISGMVTNVRIIIKLGDRKNKLRLQVNLLHVLGGSVIYVETSDIISRMCFNFHIMSCELLFLDSGRSRWVYYSDEKYGWDYDGSQVPAEW